MYMLYFKSILLSSVNKIKCLKYMYKIDEKINAIFTLDTSI